MCDTTLWNLGRLRCTHPDDTHPGQGHRYQAADAPDGKHDDNREDDR